jgi:hypothetical protein
LPGSNQGKADWLFVELMVSLHPHFKAGIINTEQSAQARCCFLQWYLSHQSL